MANTDIYFGSSPCHLIKNVAPRDFRHITIVENDLIRCQPLELYSKLKQIELEYFFETKY